MENVPLQIVLGIAGIFLLLCVIASKASTKLGVPALVLFLGVGMLAGSDGIGGIQFSDAGLAKTLGTIALAFILFSGGLDTRWEVIKPVVLRGVSLATVGVVATAALVGLFTHYVLGFGLIEGLLLGAVVSSTDAAAVFGVLRSRSVQLKHRITPLLEFESGSNDPLAVFMTVGLTELALNSEANPWHLLPSLLLQLPVGIAVGYAVGIAAAWVINRVRLEYDGLYPVVTIAAACISFGIAYVLRGNEFMSVYIAGLTLGNRNFLRKVTLLQFHEAIAWLMQITMFVVLGLLVFPKQVLEVALPGLALSAFLMLVARPLAVFLSLAFSRMKKRTKFFISWAGLRGAVPIILATFPLLEEVPVSNTIFNLVFFVVLTSVAIQGTTLAPMARWLGVVHSGREVASDMRPARNSEIMEVIVEADSPADGRQVVELALPPTSLLVLLKRGGTSYIPRGGTVLRPGDIVMIATRREDHEDLRSRFQQRPHQVA
ncbi:MAG TPA: potassium/proton antiporter [Fimbriimonadaceae bacterium]|nr:potassium/proton antiporter [Fimbriimonadaceae bacterium]